MNYSYKCRDCGNRFQVRLGVYSPATAFRAHWDHAADSCPKCGSVDLREASTWGENLRNFLIAYNST